MKNLTISSNKIRFDCLLRLSELNAKHSTKIEDKHYETIIRTWNDINSSTMLGTFQRKKFDLGLFDYVTGIPYCFFDNFPAMYIFINNIEGSDRIIFNPTALILNVPDAIGPYEYILRELFNALFYLSNIASDAHAENLREKPIIDSNKTYSKWFVSFVENIQKVNQSIIEDVIKGIYNHGSRYELCTINKETESNDDVNNAINYSINYFPECGLSYDENKSVIVFTA